MARAPGDTSKWEDNPEYWKKLTEEKMGIRGIMAYIFYPLVLLIIFIIVTSEVLIDLFPNYNNNIIRWLKDGVKNNEG